MNAYYCNFFSTRNKKTIKKQLSVKKKQALAGIFQDFRHNKQKEIDKLQDDIKNSEKDSQVVKKQLEEF